MHAWLRVLHLLGLVLLGEGCPLRSGVTMCADAGYYDHYDVPKCHAACVARHGCVAWGVANRGVRRCRLCTRVDKFVALHGATAGCVGSKVGASLLPPPTKAIPAPVCTQRADTWACRTAGHLDDMTAAGCAAECVKSTTCLTWAVSPRGRCNLCRDEMQFLSKRAGWTAGCVGGGLQPLPGAHDLGCFATSSHRYTSMISSGRDVTPAGCMWACVDAGFAHCGVMHSGECWCGHRAPGVKTALTACRSGVHAYSLEEPRRPPAKLYGCYDIDVSGGDVVWGAWVMMFLSSGTTVEECTEVCAWNGHAYAGLEYGTKCWCGGTLLRRRVGWERCGMPCVGDASQTCGGRHVLSVYAVGGSAGDTVAAYAGCYGGGVGAVLAFTNEDAGVGECADVCNSWSYPVVALSGDGECWCRAGGLPSPTHILPHTSCGSSEGSAAFSVYSITPHPSVDAGRAVVDFLLWGFKVLSGALWQLPDDFSLL